MPGPIIRKLYYSTAEVSEIAQVKPYVLNNWESLFPQIKPTVRGNRRLFTPAELELILKIRELKDRGCSNEVIREELSHPISRDTVAVRREESSTESQDFPKTDAGMFSGILNELREILRILNR